MSKSESIRRPPHSAILRFYLEKSFFFQFGSLWSLNAFGILQFKLLYLLINIGVGVIQGSEAGHRDRRLQFRYEKCKLQILNSSRINSMDAEQLKADSPSVYSYTKSPTKKDRCNFELRVLHQPNSGHVTIFPIESIPALQMRNADAANWCTPYTMNSRAIKDMTTTPITRTPMGHTSYATSTRKAMRETVDNNMQKVGMREDNEKKTYELYTSRERYYNEQLNVISVWVVSSARRVHTMNVSKSTQS
jgi:hypothetical protein